MADPAAPPAPAAGPSGSLADTAPTCAGGPWSLARGAAVGRYLVLHLLGEGGMGAVYAAYDPELDRKVALKLLKLDPSGAEVARARLMREAQAMARLSHPNVVAVHDAGVLGEQLFVAMELVDGQTLTAWLGARPRTQREVLHAFVAAGEGLAAAHAAGIVHRDFKPDNVLVDRGGRVRVTDFGLARAEQREEPAAPEPSPPATRSSPEVTVSGKVAGTPAYMSPEQFMGGATDARTDQFSFCASLFEALAGERPFEGDDFASLRASVLLQAPRLAKLPKSVPTHVRRLLARGLARRPEERFGGMQQLLGELRRDPAARARRIAAWAVPLLAVAAALGVIGAWRHQDERRCASEAQAAARARWGPEQREAVRASLAGAGLGEEAPQAALSALDAHARDWEAASGQACEAQRAGAENADEVRCLQRAALQQAAVARRLATAAPTWKAYAGRLLELLRPPSECLQRTARARPSPDAASEAEASLLAEVVDLQLANETGQFTQVLERVQALLPRALEAGASSAAAQLSMMQGAAHYNRAEGEAALAAYRQAARHADRAGDDEQSLLSRTRLANTYSNVLFRGPESLEAAQDADAWLARQGAPPRLALEVASAFCNAQIVLHHEEQSLARCATVVELASRVYGPGALRTTIALGDYAGTLEQAGRHAAALDEYRRTLERLAKDPFRQPLRLVAMWGNVAIVLFNLGRSGEALAALDAAGGHLRPVGGEAAVYAVWLGLIRGEVLELQGDLDGAERAYEQTFEAGAGDEMLRAEILAGRARLLVQRGRAKEALALAREAVKVAGHHPDPGPRVFCDLALAQALWETGEDRSEALSLARSSLALLQGPEDGYRRAWIERWLEGKAKR